MEILMDLHFMRATGSENHIFSSKSVCVSPSVISITQNQIAAETTNFIYSTFVLCVDATSNFSRKIGQKLYVQEHTKEF